MNIILLAQHNDVITLNIVPEKIEMINKGIFPIKDEEIKTYLQKDDINFQATLSKEEAHEDAKYIIINTPTDYGIENAIRNILFCPANIVPLFVPKNKKLVARVFEEVMGER